MIGIGIVGLPNVGKSTLFNAITKAGAAEAANYPFCTIEPNVGMVTVPDERLDKLAKIVNPQQIQQLLVQFFEDLQFLQVHLIFHLEQLPFQYLALLYKKDSLLPLLLLP